MAASLRKSYVLLGRINRNFNQCRLLSSSKTSSQCEKPTATSDGKRTSNGYNESTEEYSFVERLIPYSQIPKPPKHDGPTPSGWTPPSDITPDLPYMIRRSRMHNVPVYTDLKHGNQKSTLIRKVEGDIWALEKDMKEYLQEVTGRLLPTQVNEVTRTIRVKGHVDQELKEWLVSKGF